MIRVAHVMKIFAQKNCVEQAMIVLKCKEIKIRECFKSFDPKKKKVNLLEDHACTLVLFLEL